MHKVVHIIYGNFYNRGGFKSVYYIKRKVEIVQ